MGIRADEGKCASVKEACLAALILLPLLLLVAACSNDSGSSSSSSSSSSDSPSSSPTPSSEVGSYDVDEQPSTVYYEIFVRSFYDTNGDGIGDLNGVTAKLDYLKQLGIGGIWLMPIQPSPSYHGYDVTDYYAINPDYGTMEDLHKLLKEAHERDIKVIMDLVVNHTSTEHPWFKEAAADAASPYRSWYHFAEQDERVQLDGAVGSNPWHAAGSSRYLGVFWEGMPDLNFDEPAVRGEMIQMGQFWLEQGLDGFRLDAAKHIYGDFASTLNLDAVKNNNQRWWQQFRSGLAKVNPGVFLIGEVWDSVTIVAPYLDRAFDSAFNFDLAGSLLRAASSESDPDAAYSLNRAYKLYGAASEGAFTDAPFLSNHDQNRVMSVLNGNAAHAKTAASLLLTLPGNPFIYYGEEIGMKGMKPDEHIREPMLWYSSLSGGEGQTTWERSSSNADPNAISVEAQLNEEQSLLAHYQMLIGWRDELPALRDGGIEEYRLDPPLRQVSSYIRAAAKERVLVLINLSNEQQIAELHEQEPFGLFDKVIRASHIGVEIQEGVISLPPYSVIIVK
ncbi:alpha-amylase [Paenibacillus sp. BIHB 4019]|uniref:Alpha-amylase n=1 Tax=Paenibacillus sp. BIHB 4019 TaxID=1870819 RepID=A0A1B2DDP3_9BACL|nr:alpha-amylase family glycosyl hydrolase [Paenibacillus sp. BIHB 4019]ANY65823.1 alpha-amylase [Paenibacillus sp. BIHB 4019]